jgi:hypothetical protein
MTLEDSENERHQQHGVLSILLELLEFWDSTERILSILAGLVLAVAFCLMPLSTFGKEDPWYFWVGSGLAALAASVLLSWVYFPPSKGKKSEARADSSNGEVSD